MNFFRKLGLLAVVVLAFAGVSVANASAAQFTASATGELTGLEKGTEIFSFAETKCTKIAATGPITALASTETEVTVNYSECKGGSTGTVPMDFTPVTYVLQANGQVQITNTFTVTATIPFTTCNFTVRPQTVGKARYSSASGSMRVQLGLSGIVYTATGLCGASGSGGTHTGEVVLHRVGGGTLSFDP